VRLLSFTPDRRYSQITPQLFVGGQYYGSGWPALAAWGITAVVNMRTEFDDHQAGIAPARYLHLPTTDNTAPTLEHLAAGVAFITQEIARGGGVYIHCKSGIGRAVTMAAAYLVSTGLTPVEAWARIRDVRPFIRPTAAQVTQLERFAANPPSPDVLSEAKDLVVGRGAGGEVNPRI